MIQKLLAAVLRGGIAIITPIFWGGWWLFGLGLLVWYPLRWWPGDSLRPVQLLNYVMPWLLGGLIPGLLAALLKKQKRLAAVLALPTMLIGLNYAPLFMPRTPPALASDLHIKVMSYNIWKRNTNVQAAIDLIRRENPDILLLQEVNPRALKNLEAQWAQNDPARPLHVDFKRFMGQAIISRYPLTPLESSYIEGRAQKVVAHTPTGDVIVWNVHTSQPILWRQHYRQFVNLAHSIQRVEAPLIVGGDFNTTDQSEVYRLINQHLQNAHWETGWGFGFSFPAHKPTIKGVPVPTPVVRIDHIFHNEHLFARRAQTLSEAGNSDHYPVIAEFSLISQPSAQQGRATQYQP